MPAGVRLRILLLGRSEKAARLYEHARAHATEPLLLEPPPGEEQAWALFEDAWRKIRCLRQQAEEPPPLDRNAFDAWLAADERHRLPLFQVAFALHLAENPADTALRGAAIIRELVRREKGRVRREAEARGIDAKALWLLWALAALHGKLDKAAIDYLRARARDDLDIPPVRDLEDISLWRDHGLNALQPDLLAAQLLEEVLQADHLSPGHWLYHGLNAAGEERRADVLSRLGRLRFDYRYTLRDGQADSTPDPLIEALARYVTDDPARCHALAPAVNRDMLEISLLPLTIAIDRTLLDHAETDSDKATWFNNLSIDLAASGDRAGGLDAIRRAVEIRERLAQENFAAYGPDLASSLNNLSNRLAESGDRAGGLDAIRRAVEIYERLVEENFAAWRPDLAASLNNLSIRLAENGDRAGGLGAIRRAVEIYERLAHENFSTYGPGLATSLNNLSVDLAKSGDHTRGMKAGRRAVEIRERLAQENFAAYGPNLALSFHNLSVRLAESGDRAGGLDAIRRAVEIYERLAQENFAAYGSNLAMSLNNLSVYLAESGDRADGLDAIWRAVEVNEQLAQESFAAHGPDLAASINNLSNRLAESGDRAGALSAIRRAVEIRERLAQENFAAYGPDLAMSLNNLSVRLAESGDRAGGLAAIRRAVEIRERLAQENFAAYGPDLAGSFGNLSNRLAEQDDHAGALAAIQRAVEIIEPFATPGTTYAEWFEAMKRSLAVLEGDATDR